MDISHRIIGASVILAVSIFATYIWCKESAKHKNRKIKVRNNIPKSEFLDLFHSIKPDFIATDLEILNELKYFSDELNLEESKLSPSDTMEIIGPAKGWEYDDELWAQLEFYLDNSKIYNLNYSKENIKNLADLIELKITVIKAGRQAERGHTPVNTRKSKESKESSQRGVIHK
jgi:hypothetical protein